MATMEGNDQFDEGLYTKRLIEWYDIYNFFQGMYVD